VNLFAAFATTPDEHFSQPAIAFVVKPTTSTWITPEWDSGWSAVQAAQP